MRKLESDLWLDSRAVFDHSFQISLISRRKLLQVGTWVLRSWVGEDPTRKACNSYYCPAEESPRTESSLTTKSMGSKDQL